MKKRLLLPAGGLVALVFLAAAPLLAQQASAPVANSSVGWIFRWINFALVFGVIIYYAIKKGGPYFRENAEAISERIAEGARAREAAEERRREIETKLAALGQEIEEMRVLAKRDSEAELQRLRAMSRDDAERIEKAAEAEIAAAERASRLELKALAARLTMERAESLLKQQIDRQNDAALFRAFVADVAGRTN